MTEKIKSIVQASIDVKKTILGDERLIALVQEIAEGMVQALKTIGKKCGTAR